MFYIRDSSTSHNASAAPHSCTRALIAVQRRPIPQIQSFGAASAKILSPVDCATLIALTRRSTCEHTRPTPPRRGLACNIMAVCHGRVAMHLSNVQLNTCTWSLAYQSSKDSGYNNEDKRGDGDECGDGEECGDDGKRGDGDKVLLPPICLMLQCQGPSKRNQHAFRKKGKNIDKQSRRHRERERKTN